jgi:hypothetical protein
MIDRVLFHIRNGTAGQVFRDAGPFAVSYVKFLAHQWRRDVGNRFRFGKSAPKFCERIWVDAEEVSEYVGNEPITELTGQHRNLASGMVVNWNQIKIVTPLRDQMKMKYCIRHWSGGVPWEELGYFDFMRSVARHRKDSLEVIRARFAMLDKAFDEARRSGNLKTRQQVDSRAFREKDGILIHIDSGGNPVFGGNGFHRMAIAKVLKLKKFPACLGVVDFRALPLLAKYRQLPAEPN